MPAETEHPRSLSPGQWCTSCGARPGLAGPAWLCRICVSRPDRLPDHAFLRNPGRRPLPAGTPRARDRYAAAGLCRQCGRRRDRTDRLACRRCRRRLADATNRHRAAHPLAGAELEAHREDVRERRRRYLAAGRCAECGRARDRPDRKTCARCRQRAADATAAHRARRAVQQAVR